MTADWDRHVEAALSPFGPVRKFGRLPAPDRCPHLQPGTPAPRVARFDGGDLQCCDRCFIAYGVGLGALFELLRRHGVREVQR